MSNMDEKMERHVVTDSIKARATLLQLSKMNGGPTAQSFKDPPVEWTMYVMGNKWTWHRIGNARRTETIYERA